MENVRAIDKSTCVRPRPGISFRPSVPCLGVDGIEKAAAFNTFPPGAPGMGIQKGCPGTRSGREVALPPGSALALRVNALNGNPLRATMTDWRDQWPVTIAI